MMISPERLDLMQQSWVRLLGRWQVPPSEAYPVFDRLVEAYQAPERHYHTLEHLAEMFKVAGRLADLVSDGPSVQLAIWYHDVVYDVQRRDNESRSAERAGEELSRLRIPPATIAQVEQLILATTHAVPVAPLDANTSVLLDADLAILGSAEARYRRYAEDIRREHARLSDAEYRVGRRKFLEGLLARPQIYYTQRLREVGEAAARLNLQREYESLSGSD